MKRLRQVMLAISIAEFFILWVAWSFYPGWISSRTINRAYRSQLSPYAYSRGLSVGILPDTGNLQTAGAYDRLGGDPLEIPVIDINRLTARQLSGIFQVYLPLVLKNPDQAGGSIRASTAPDQGVDRWGDDPPHLQDH